jgi:hypothetical protein
MFEHALSTLRRAAEHGYPWSIYPAEATALVTEVERLRAECRTLQEWCEIAAEAENQNADEARKERAAVVSFLREWQNTMDDRITHDDLDYAIAVIERGEHRREETE